MKQRFIYIVMLAGGIIGMLAAFLQTTEKIQLLKHKDALLACDLNSIFSCTNVLNAWQSSVFGFPNSIMCVALFTILASIALVGATNNELRKGLRLGIQGLALAVLLFALWFLWQSIYVIGSLCILCIFCFAGLLLVNWAWLRINAKDLPIGDRAQALLAKAIASHYDALGWLTLGVIVALAMTLRFI